MEERQYSLKGTATVLVFVLSAVILSCSKSSDPITSEITQTVNNESTQDAQQDEVDDIATGQLNIADAAGRLTTASDDRVACAQIIFGGDTTQGKKQGTITIDFDNGPSGSANPGGCVDPRGNTRKGSILISWSGGRWWQVNSNVTITFSNYNINGVVINGTRVLSNVTTTVGQLTWIIISNVTSVWPDSTKAMRTVTKTRLWNVSAGTVTFTQTVGDPSAASGTDRYGKVYTVQITNPVVYSSTCSSDKVYFPVSGTKIITIDTPAKSITIDFGSGTCDQTFSLMYDGKTETLTAKNDDSND